LANSSVCVDVETTDWDGDKKNDGLIVGMSAFVEHGRVIDVEGTVTI